MPLAAWLPAAAAGMKADLHAPAGGAIGPVITKENAARTKADRSVLDSIGRTGGRGASHGGEPKLQPGL